MRAVLCIPVLASGGSPLDRNATVQLKAVGKQLTITQFKRWRRSETGVAARKRLKSAQETNPWPRPRPRPRKMNVLKKPIPIVSHGENGDLISASDSGALSARTIAKVEMPGITLPTTTPALAPTVGAKTDSPGFPMT